MCTVEEERKPEKGSLEENRDTASPVLGCCLDLRNCRDLNLPLDEKSHLRELDDALDHGAGRNREATLFIAGLGQDHWRMDESLNSQQVF